MQKSISRVIGGQWVYTSFDKEIYLQDVSPETWNGSDDHSDQET